MTTPVQQAPANNNNIFDLLGEDVVTPVAAPTVQQQKTPIPSFDQLSISQASTPTTTTPTTPMNGIWSSGSNLFSLDSLGNTKTTSTAKTAQGPSMNTLKTSTLNNDWNSWATTNTKPQENKPSSVFDDLLSL